ncbi:MAG TPA: ABC transporter ATP-binding protein [Conexibacter sp.]|nr:ABC transporter ATP-binding protein [Conexibacter sp.]
MGLLARGLTRSFAGRPVLSGVDLDVEAGTLAVMEGANGAGKTTLLRIFATVVRPDGGRAEVDGHDVARAGARVRKRIGVAFVNERSLFWRLSGQENLQLFARTRGVPRRAVAGQVAALLDELELGQIAPRRVADLSAGQRQRLIIARAGLGDPTGLLIDEPLRGLDDAGIATIIAFLRRRASEGASVLVTAPKADELEQEADVLLRLRDGVVLPWHEPERASA